MKNLLLLIVVCLTGCAEIATSVAINSGVQVAGEQYLIANKKPVTKCNLLNIAKGNNMCRIKRTYKAIV